MGNKPKISFFRWNNIFELIWQQIMLQIQVILSQFLRAEPVSSSFTAYTVLTGGTSRQEPIQNVASVGSSGRQHFTK